VIWIKHLLSKSVGKKGLSGIPEKKKNTYTL